MKKFTGVFIALLLTATFLPVSSFAAEKGGKEGHKEIINATCPVMGGPISDRTPYTAEYKGKTVGFCCGACPAAFKKNPEKYEGNLYKDEKAGPILKNLEEGGKT